MADVLLSSIVQPAETTSQLFGVDPQPVFTAPSAGAAVRTFSGALTANVLKEMVNVSGQGHIEYLVLQRVDSTARSTRLRLTIDGAIALDIASTVISFTGGNQYVIGLPSARGPAIPFAQSFSVDIASSLTETDKLAYYIRYRI